MLLPPPLRPATQLQLRAAHVPELSAVLPALPLSSAAAALSARTALTRRGVSAYRSASRESSSSRNRIVHKFVLSRAVSAGFDVWQMR